MPISRNELLKKLQSYFPDGEINIKDLSNDQDHYHVTVLSDMFKNKTKIQQHQMVYEALSEVSKGILHALAITTKTPQ